MSLRKVCFVVVLFCVTIAISMLYAGTVVFSFGRILDFEGGSESVARLIVFLIVVSVNFRYFFPIELAEEFEWSVKAKVPISVVCFTNMLSSLFVTEVVFVAVGDAFDLSVAGNIVVWFSVFSMSFYVLMSGVRSTD